MRQDFQAGIFVAREVANEREKSRGTLVSRFRSSQHFSEPRFELRNRKDTSKPIDLVWLWFRSPHDQPAAQKMRTSEPPYQGFPAQSDAGITNVSEGFTVSGILNTTGLNHRLDVAVILTVRLSWLFRESRAEILIAG
jgi:hypothetical protein